MLEIVYKHNYYLFPSFSFKKNLVIPVKTLKYNFFFFVLEKLKEQKLEIEIPLLYFVVALIRITSLSGKLYIQLKQNKEAKRIYEELLERNPENTFYYSQLLEACQLTSSSDKVDLFRSYQEKFPRALAPRRLPLNFTTG